MKIFFFSFIFLYCVVVLADVSNQKARDFAVQFVEILRSDKADQKIENLVSDEIKTNGQIGFLENFWSSETASRININAEHGFKNLVINRVLIRAPDSDNPSQIKSTDYELANCLIPPEKIAVVYFSNKQQNIRAVLILPLVSRHGAIKLCPMTLTRVTNLTASAAPITKEIPFRKNLSDVPGVEIVKIADDRSSYGFPPEMQKKRATTIETNPSGCTLRQTILYIMDSETWAEGLNHLPSGRFRIHCELMAGENESVTNKLLNAIAGAFDLNIKTDDHYIWQGYRVVPPNPLPDCFRITKNAVGQSTALVGNYEGYSLNHLISSVLPNKPFDLLSTNTTERYDVHFDVWPEAYGEIAALEQLGFQITRTNLQRKTLVINNR